ncbi:hypothetical protein MA16_Dca027180 [Dendrobium catenatum]|uniref:Uncharacterized protein n=1 Tax=Dendrobium catenatum TaxID=906689 RepID=A0A2I0XB63_9ASPA|nr:hypothetical protein MA16_Dca027180 [Dendrobium catenatum]
MITPSRYFPHSTTTRGSSSGGNIAFDRVVRLEQVVQTLQRLCNAFPETPFEPQFAMTFHYFGNVFQYTIASLSNHVFQIDVATGWRMDREGFLHSTA